MTFPEKVYQFSIAIAFEKQPYCLKTLNLLVTTNTNEKHYLFFDLIYHLLLSQVCICTVRLYVM
jgi:hypothetical protein